MRTPTRAAATAGFLVTAAAVLAGCAGEADAGGTTPEESPTPASTAAGAVDLSGSCPETVVVQTDWNPEAEHGHLYELVGDDYTVDADLKAVTGDLVHQGEPTGVQIEVRAGGPAIGFQAVPSQMYQDTDITLGYVNTDEAIQFSADLPTTAVFAENEKSPQMIMWDPETYPDVTTIEELGSELVESGGVIRYFGGASYMEYLIGTGMLEESVTDGSYDGTPANFVAAQGRDAQQGFASAEPYIYENEVEAWGKSVELQLIHDTGYPIYAQAISARTGDLEELGPCLEGLVPVMQQALVDYVADPAETNELILDLVDQYANGWVYSAEVAEFAVQQMRELEIVGNGEDDMVGDMAEERVQEVIDITTPIFTEAGQPPAEDLQASDLYTNEFLDESIGF